MSKKTIKTLVLYAIAIAIIAVFTVNFVDWVTQPISEAESTEFCGENVTWEVDKKKLIIRGEGPMDDFITDSVPWPGAAKTSVTKIVIEEGVTSIGAYAFEGFKNLEEIQLASSVTSIGDYAFHWCKSLAEVTIPSSITEIGTYAFAECRALTSITLSDKMTSVSPFAFMLCENLTTVDIGKGITEIGEHAFANCYNLASVSLPENVKTIGAYAFDSCSSLSAVNLENVTEISDGAFQSTACDQATLLANTSAKVSENAFFNAGNASSVIVEE